MTKKRIKSVFVSLTALIIIFNVFFIASAGNASTQADFSKELFTAGNKAGWAPPTNLNTLPQIIQYVISAFLGLLGIIFIVLIIYAGFNWMTAQGDEEKVTKAKETLTRAVIGLIIIVAAYSITYFVFSSLPGGGGAETGGYSS